MVFCRTKERGRMKEMGPGRTGPRWNCEAKESSSCLEKCLQLPASEKCVSGSLCSGTETKIRERDAPCLLASTSRTHCAVLPQCLTAVLRLYLPADPGFRTELTDPASLCTISHRGLVQQPYSKVTSSSSKIFFSYIDHA